MIIEGRTVVTLQYTLTIDENGKQVEIEKTTAEKPFVFLFGKNNALPSFEKNLAGKTVGDTFEFVLISEEAYGVNDEKNMANIPIEAFLGADGKPDPKLLFEGNILSMQDQEGRMFRGVVVNISDIEVLMDFNHPLADKDLHFKGEVVDIRLATLEELTHGHVHGAGGHQH